MERDIRDYLEGYKEEVENLKSEIAFKRGQLSKVESIIIRLQDVVDKTRVIKGEK